MLGLIAHLLLALVNLNKQSFVPPSIFAHISRSHTSDAGKSHATKPRVNSRAELCAGGWHSRRQRERQACKANKGKARQGKAREEKREGTISPFVFLNFEAAHPNCGLKWLRSTTHASMHSAFLATFIRGTLLNRMH